MKAGLFVAVAALFAVTLAACSQGSPAAPTGLKVEIPLPAIHRTSNDVATIAAATWPACQASDQSWVRRALLAFAGRRTKSQAEVNAYEDIIRAVDAAAPAAANALSPGRRTVLEAIVASEDFRLRWSDFLMDALHVARIEDKTQESCYGAPLAAAVDPALATWLRDHEATERFGGTPAFTMRELLGSALAADDLSVAYRGHLFAMLAKPINGANLDRIALERARRQDFGGVFDAVYLNRNLVCLGCHNSEYSVTFDPDPARNRAWPARGHFERALFGAPDGHHATADATTKGTDFFRAHSMLRVDGVANAPNAIAPYGWDASRCGAFGRPAGDELLGIDTYFGDLRGDRASVWDLEAQLHRGVEKLSAHGVTFGADDSVADADEAFAYLVAQNIVDQVWAETMGSRLTIANGYPRNSVQRDILEALTSNFAGHHFSLVTLLSDIAAHPAFNLKAPEEGCGSSAYALPNAFDPWTIANADPALRGNGGGDGVFPISGRPLVRGLHRALSWPDVPAYPSDEAFQTSAGFFLKDAQPGHRGLDFQGRLMWEYVYGACASQGGEDFITRLTDVALHTRDANLGDGILAVKDRLLGEPQIDSVTEQPLLEALLEAPFASRPDASLESHLRRACGLFLSTPQFMLAGIVPADARDVPKLTLPEASYRATCEAAAPVLARAGHRVTCRADSLAVKIVAKQAVAQVQR